MVKRIGLLVMLAVMAALMLHAGGWEGVPTANAAIPTPCPSAPGVPGGVTYHVFATLPIGVPAADGVCVQLPGFPILNTGSVTQAPPTCPSPPPAADAGGSAAAGWVWVDWGVGCVPAGQTVVLQFEGPAGLTLGRVTNAATWSITGGGTVTTDATVWPDICPASPSGVGGVPLFAVATAPVGGPYDGVCMSLVAPVPGVHSPTVLLSPPACPAALASTGAAVLQLWDDFTTKCANAGDTIVMKFFGPSGLIGPCAACTTWLDGAVIGDASVSAAGFLNPGAGTPCLQDHIDDSNGDGYSNSDGMTPPGAPSCTGAYPSGGGLGTDPLGACAGRPPASTGSKIARADVDVNGRVNILDLSAAAAAYMQSGFAANEGDKRNEFDQDANGVINILDLAAMASQYNRIVPAC